MEHKFCKDAFDYIADQIRKKFYDSLAHPAEMVGVIAAQSIGEPSTQLSQCAASKILINNKRPDTLSTNAPLQTV
jgi:hypothetical protein